MNQGCKQNCEQKAEQIIDLTPWPQWFACASGQFLQAWSQARCDQASANCFGWHALQLGLPAWPLLRNCRVQRHWVAAIDANIHAANAAGPAATPDAAPNAEPNVAPHMALDLTALPFAESSIDLIVLPYALQASGNPHATLREVARVLVPEGHLLILDCNPASLWGLQHKKRLLMQRLAGGQTTAPHTEQPLAAPMPFPHTLPPLQARQWVSYRRLRDWLPLLGFEISAGRFGGYRPMVRSQQWFNRLLWLEAAGDRWWPFLGGAYFLLATKRVRGMRMLPQPRWQLAQQTAGTAAAIRREEAQVASPHAPMPAIPAQAPPSRSPSA